MAKTAAINTIAIVLSPGLPRKEDAAQKLTNRTITYTTRSFTTRLLCLLRINFRPDFKSLAYMPVSGLGVLPASSKAQLHFNLSYGKAVGLFERFCGRNMAEGSHNLGMTQ
jgi:hypothetical protein